MQRISNKTWTRIVLIGFFLLLAVYFVPLALSFLP